MHQSEELIHHGGEGGIVNCSGSSAAGAATRSLTKTDLRLWRIRGMMGYGWTDEQCDGLLITLKIESDGSLISSTMVLHRRTIPSSPIM